MSCSGRSHMLLTFCSWAFCLFVHLPALRVMVGHSPAESVPSCRKLGYKYLSSGPRGSTAYSIAIPLFTASASPFPLRSVHHLGCYTCIFAWCFLWPPKTSSIHHRTSRNILAPLHLGCINFAVDVQHWLLECPSGAYVPFPWKVVYLIKHLLLAFFLHCFYTPSLLLVHLVLLS